MPNAVAPRASPEPLAEGDDVICMIEGYVGTDHASLDAVHVHPAAYATSVRWSARVGATSPGSIIRCPDEASSYRGNVRGAYASSAQRLPPPPAAPVPARAELRARVDDRLRPRASRHLQRIVPAAAGVPGAAHACGVAPVRPAHGVGDARHRSGGEGRGEDEPAAGEAPPRGSHALRGHTLRLAARPTADDVGRPPDRP